MLDVTMSRMKLAKSEKEFFNRYVSEAADPRKQGTSPNIVAIDTESQG